MRLHVKALSRISISPVMAAGFPVPAAMVVKLSFNVLNGKRTTSHVKLSSVMLTVPLNMVLSSVTSFSFL
jgi:hypothetical protein